MLQPQKDLYGPEADRSNLADYIELLALADAPMSPGDLADYLADTTWTVRSRELYVNAADEVNEDSQDGGAETIPQQQWAEDVFAMCEYRGELLGENYPFEHTAGRLKRRAHHSRHDPYLALLAITVAHHYDVAVAGPLPERAFEEVVHHVMIQRGLETSNLGAAGRRVNSFMERVDEAGREIGVAATPQAAVSRAHANDEKVDVISNLSWGDQRVGHWIFVGQSTVGRSNTWQVKMMQPRPPQWRDLMNSTVLPIAYLAVPHHIEDEQLLDLTRGDERLVLDRIRLVRHMGAPPAGARSVTATVLSEVPYDPRRH